MSEVWIRDRDGQPVPAETVRESLRRDLGNCTQEMLDANARGEIHPDQVSRVNSFRRQHLVSSSS